jgi:TfoX/Sxy family transcriptional regulator of competence genes
MTAQEEFIQYVEELLHAFFPLEKSRLFSGVSLAIEGQKFGIICEDTLYLIIIDMKLQNRYKSEGSSQFAYTRKDKDNPIIIKNWWSVPDYALEQDGALERLVREALLQNL